MVKYVSSYILRVHLKKKSAKDLSNDADMMFLCCFCFLIFFIKAYVVGTQLNCLDLRQFK